MGDLVGLNTLQITGMYALERLPEDFSKLTGLTNLEIGECGSKCRQSRRMLPASIGDIVVKLTNLQDLTLRRVNIKELPAGIGRLTKLRVLALEDRKIEELPDELDELRRLERLHISSPNLRTLPKGIGGLDTLTNLSLSRMRALRRLPASIAHLTKLQELSIWRCGVKTMANIETLTALDTLVLDVSDYNRGCRVYETLARSLPSLQQLQFLRLSCEDKDDGSDGVQVNMIWAEDVVAIGHALKAWPLPLLLDIGSDEESIKLSMFHRALGLPAEAQAAWNNATTLDFFRVQQHKVAAFCSGLHARLGAASDVSRLNDQVLDARSMYVCACVCVCVKQGSMFFAAGRGNPGPHGLSGPEMISDTLIAGITPTGGDFQTPRSRNLLQPNKSTPTLFVPFWVVATFIRLQQIP